MTPLAVTEASAHIFGNGAGLGPAISLTVAGGYGIAIVALVVALVRFRSNSSEVHRGVPTQ